MGRHGRPESEALSGVDVAAEVESGPVVEMSAPVQAERTHGHRRSPSPVERAAAATAPAPPPGAVSATVLGSTAATSRHRRADRATRRTATRRQLLVIVAVVLAVLLVIGVTVVLSGRGGDANVAAPPRAPHQSTLLVQVAGPDGTAVANALVGVTPGSGGDAALLIPAGLLVDDAGSGNMSFGETLTLPSKSASTDALTDLLGVRVGDGWVLTQAGLAALVDAVGGVQATVDVDVITKNAKGAQAVAVRAGSQRLNGSQAAAYATYLASGEPETVRLARFNDVFDEVLRSLPATQAGITATLTKLATGSRSSLTPARLATMLVAMRTAAVKEQLHYDVLPVNDLDTGDTVDTYGLNSTKANAMLASLFAPSLLKDGAGDVVRVLVENGIGTPDLIESARARLVDKGFQFITGGNASELSATDASVVLIEDGSQKSQARGARVAEALKLPASSIQINPRGQTVADVIVILGADFKP